MAEIRSISKDSSLNFAALLKDWRGFIVDARKVHVKGKFFTGSTPVFEFEVNKGVATGCKLDGFLLSFQIDISMFRPGRLRCSTVIYEQKSIIGDTKAANEQFVEVQIVPAGTAMTTEQGPFCIDIILYTAINDADLLVWGDYKPMPLPVVPGGGGSVSPSVPSDWQQQITSMFDSFVKSPMFAQFVASSPFVKAVASLALADKSLSNVAPDDLKKVAKLAGLASTDMEMSFVDSVLQQTFKSALGQSLDRSIRIAMIPNGKDDDGNDKFIVDFSVAKLAAQEGVAMVVEYSQIINFAFPDNQPSMSNVLYHGGSSVHIDKTTGGVVVQEIDGRDPNITGGSTFVAVLDFVTDKEEDNTLTQDGSIKLALCDKDGNYIKTINGGNCVIQRDYKAGMTVEDMHFAVVFKAKEYQEVFYRIIGEFEQEEAVSVGLGTGMCIQCIEEDSGMGEALQTYEIYTGSHIEIGKEIYSSNNLNFARVTAKDTVLTIGGPDRTNLGKNLTLDTRTSITQQVIGNGLNIKSDSGSCVFSLYKRYIYSDLIRLNGSDIDISVSIRNKTGAMRVVRLGYKGPLPAPEPNLLSFSNDQPQYNKGWTELDSLFIPEDVLSDKRRLAKTFIFPVVEDYSECAFLLRPETDATPLDVTIFDFEGDIKPGFVHVLVKEHFYPGQMGLMQRDLFTKSAMMCPSGYASLRFTINSTDTKLPVGIFKTNSFLKNNNAWYDAGSAAKEIQGDMAVLKSFRGKVSYSLNLFNEKDSDSTVDVWLARVEQDGSFTKVAESALQTTVKAGVSPASGNNNQVSKVAFTHNFKKGESYRLFAKANQDDGAYVQVNNGSHVAMIELIVDVEYFTEIPQDIIHDNSLAVVEFTDGGKPVVDPSLYKLQIDVKSFDTKVVEVK